MGFRFMLRRGYRVITSLFKYTITLIAAIAIGGCTPFQPYTENSSDRHYVVQPGDNIHSIAFLLETTPRQLQRANPWANSGKLQPGMRLSVPRQLAEHEIATVEPDNHDQLQHAPQDLQLRSAEFVWPLRHFEISSHFGNRRGRLSPAQRHRPEGAARNPDSRCRRRPGKILRLQKWLWPDDRDRSRTGYRNRLRAQRP
jgi:hypothetical protein